MGIISTASSVANCFAGAYGVGGAGRWAIAPQPKSKPRRGLLLDVGRAFSAAPIDQFREGLLLPLLQVRDNLSQIMVMPCRIRIAVFPDLGYDFILVSHWYSQEEVLVAYKSPGMYIRPPHK